MTLEDIKAKLEDKAPRPKKENRVRMRKGVWALLVCALLAISGCAAQVKPSIVGGSRADGVIRVFYEHGAYQNPQINLAQTDQQVQERCARWGYTGKAERFDAMKECTVPGSPLFGGCSYWRVTTEYQCTE